MSFLPTLAEVQSIAQDDVAIQALTGTETNWILIQAYVDKTVTEPVYGTLEKEAQIYLAAHMLSMSTQPVGGRGPLSSESIGDVSQSFTLPWLNRTTVLGGTQFGIMFLEIRNQVVFAFAFVKAAP